MAEEKVFHMSLHPTSYRGVSMTADTYDDRVALRAYVLKYFRHLMSPLPFLIVLTMFYAPAYGADPSTMEARQKWAIQAQALIDELAKISAEVAKTELAANAISQRLEARGRQEEIKVDLVLLPLQSWEIHAKADRVLWKLWLTTGKVPTPQSTHEPLSANLSRNAREFREYVATHASATEEELARLGLTNAVGAFGSPLWYPTMQYLTKTANLEFECIIFIDVIPKRSIILQPLKSDAYKELSAALGKWLEANKDRMVWDQNARRFRPRNGEYVGVPELSDALLGASRKTEDEQTDSSKK